MCILVPVNRFILIYNSIILSFVTTLHNITPAERRRTFEYIGMIS